MQEGLDTGFVGAFAHKKFTRFHDRKELAQQGFFISNPNINREKIALKLKERLLTHDWNRLCIKVF